MKKLFFRMLAVCLCICLLPVWALAQDEINDGTPVTYADFDASVHFYADGFPQDGAAHYADWETFLSKISLSGEVKAQSFPKPLSRVMLDGSLDLNGEPIVPFEYDGYCNFRYLRSPALDGASVHFQMHNFFQFMLKGYYFMGLPTQLLAVPLYPEATVELLQMYGEPIVRMLGGEGSRVVSYDDLYALCEELSLMASEDINYKIYYYFTSLMTNFGGDYVFLEKLPYLEDILNYLDPNAMGMTITVDGEKEEWLLGETVVFEKDADGWRFELPCEDGYVFTAAWQNTGSECAFDFTVLLEEEEWLYARVTANGLGNALSAEGEVTVDLGGEGLSWYELVPQTFLYRYSRTAEEKPYDMDFSIDWVHPETGRRAFGVECTAFVEELPYTAVYDRPIDNQDDFFHLNESFMAEYKERFAPTIALAAVPFVLEMPAGIISDVVAWMEYTGLLAFMGIE
ncbi:MAG: hypothetical protein IKJ26_10960 [Clostridia bacterium]|nr:hypothetical protein [Clostridia bacterium]